MWRHVASALAADFTVICADLRGYGASGKPPSTSDHTPYSKSAMASDMVRLMRALGFHRFHVTGHDRGARVAYRIALNHPDQVERLAVLDIIPTSEALGRADSRFALAFWPWSLLAQPQPLPERLLLSDPRSVVENALGHWGSDRATFPPEVFAAYVEALEHPDTVHAICEEYRAAATIDVAQDQKDREAGRRIRSPTLVLWSAGSSLDSWYEDAGGPLGIWRHWAEDVTGRSIGGGHFFPEQNPNETTSELHSFFTGTGTGLYAGGMC
jgi:haloacetate dehalogenase